ncbi:MAG: VTT domain-containing protein [Anaerolineales bacterium]
MLVVAGLVIWFLREPVVNYLTFVADKPAFSAYIKSFGFWGPFVIIGFQILQVIFAMIPGYAFYIGAGYIYGIPIAYPLSLLSTVVGSQIAFAIGRYWGRPVVYKLAPKDIIQRWDSRARKFGFIFFLTSFLLPIFPADSMNYLAGLTSIDGKKFLLASFLGRAPAILFLTGMGAFGLELTTMGLPWTTWLLIAAGCIAIYWGWQYIFNRIKPDSLRF